MAEYLDNEVLKVTYHNQAFDAKIHEDLVNVDLFFVMGTRHVKTVKLADVFSAKEIKKLMKAKKTTDAADAEYYYDKASK